MKITLIAAMLGLMLPGIAAAQAVEFEFGTTLNAVLSDTLDARKNAPGDAVRAKTSEDVKVGGVTVIPRGARLLGRVTRTQVSTQAGSQSKLGFTFEQAEWKNGGRIPLHTTLFALAAPEGMVEDHSPPVGDGFGGPVGNLARPAADDMGSLVASRPKQAELKPSPDAIGGLNSSGLLYASSRGVFGLDGVSLEPDAVPSKGSAIVLADARTVRLPRGSRMLLSVRSNE